MLWGYVMRYVGDISGKSTNSMIQYPGRQGEKVQKTKPEFHFSLKVSKVYGGQ